MTTNEAASGLTLLRKPFPPNQISKLPKPKSKDAPKGRCPECGGWHGLPAVHLDYVGHAALTDRLLDADPGWTWEPAAVGPEGLPVIDNLGGMWIRLTVCGVTRLGYGHAGEKQGGDAIKEVIGDALRNAAMRFGAALDLWHKGDLHADEEPAPKAVRGVVNAVLHDAPALPPQRQEYIDTLARELVEEADNGRTAEAIVQAIDSEKLDDMEKIYLWSKLPSALRTAIKKAQAAQREKAAA